VAGHNIRFKKFDDNFSGVIDRQDVRDTINLLFNGPDSEFLIVGYDEKKGRRGSCHLMLWGYMITLDLPTIKKHMENGMVVGGNTTHKDIRTAVLSVLAHELQHANQFCTHGTNSKIWTTGRSYLGRPSEIEARSFADDSSNIIEIMLGIKSSLIKEEKKYEDVTGEIASIFLEQKEDVTFSDIISELKIAGANNPVNVGKIVHTLIEAGKKVTK